MRRFTVLLDPKLPTCDKGPAGGCRLVDPDLIEEARALDAIALFQLGREKDVDEQLEKILRANPTFEARPPKFPIPVADRFAMVKARLKPELDALLAKKAQAAHLQQVYEQQRADWIQNLQTLAGEETVLEKNSRLIATLPFGIGHFQNGRQVPGVLFAVGEASMIVGAVVSFGIVSNLSAVDPSKPDPATGRPIVVDALNQQIRTAATANRAFFLLWGIITAGDIVTAHATFVPERALPPRKRPVPPPPRPPSPNVSVLPGGVSLGVSGVF